jgi:hypothetical protein
MARRHLMVKAILTGAGLDRRRRFRVAVRACVKHGGGTLQQAGFSNTRIRHSGADLSNRRGEPPVAP